MNKRMKLSLTFRTSFTILLAFSIAMSAVITPATIARSAPARSDAFAPHQTAGVIQFRILKVTCHEQTFDLWGDDDIALGGTVASKFGVDMVAYADLGAFDDDDDDSDGVPSEVTYDEWVLAEIPIEDVTDYTRIQLSLVEVDLGGKEEFLANLTQAEYEYVQTEMLVYFITLLEEWLDGGVNAADADFAVNPFGWLIGLALQQAASAATDYILDFLWDWLIGTLQDDMFRVVVVPAPVSELMSRAATSVDAPTETGTIVIADHGAHYEIEYSWTGLSAPMVTAAGSSTMFGYRPTYNFDPEMEQMLRLWAATLENHIYLPIISDAP